MNDLQLKIFREMHKKIQEEISYDIFQTFSTASAAPETSLTMDSILQAKNLLEEAPKEPWGYGIPKIHITEDSSQVKRKVVVRGLADKRRPNNKKMLYRKVTTIIPLIYFYKSPMGIIVIGHPIKVAEFKAKLREWNNESR